MSTESVLAFDGFTLLKEQNSPDPYHQKLKKRFWLFSFGSTDFAGMHQIYGYQIYGYRSYQIYVTAWKVSVFGVILVRIFQHPDGIRRDTSYLSVFSPNTDTDITPDTDTFYTVYFFWGCQFFLCKPFWVASGRGRVKNIQLEIKMAAFVRYIKDYWYCQIYSRFVLEEYCIFCKCVPMNSTATIIFLQKMKFCRKRKDFYLQNCW